MMKKLAAIILAVLMIVSSLYITSFAAETEIVKSDSWVISESSAIGGDKAKKCFDGNPSSYWHSNYTVVDGQIVSKELCPHTITVDFGEILEVSGWRYTPRTDNSNGTFKLYNVYASEDGTTFKKIYEGAFEYNGGNAKEFTPTSASWGNVSMKAIKIEAVSTIGGYGTCAEITFLTGGSGTAIQNGEIYKEPVKEEKVEEKKEELKLSGEKIPYDSSWNASATSTYPGQGIEKVFDNNPKSFWHSNYTAEGSVVTHKDPAPYDIVVDFGEAKKVSGFVYTPRASGSSGLMLEYAIYASENGTNFKEISKGSFDYGKGYTDMTPRMASWGDVSMKVIKITITKSAAGVATCGDLDFLTGGEKVIPEVKTEEKKEDKKPESTESTEKFASNGIPVLNRNGWKATVNSDISNSVRNIFDGNIKTYWHSHYTHEGATVTGHDNPPYYLEVTLPEAKYISGIILAPRTDSHNGRFLTANIKIKDSDEGEYFTIYENYEFEEGASERELLFVSNVLVKGVMVEVTVSTGGYGTLSEFYLLAENEKFKKVSYEEFADNEAANKLYQLNSANISVECDYGHWSVNHINNILDGSPKSFWQTENITDKNIVPTIRLDLGSVQTFSRYDYTPRQSKDYHGFWEEINILGSVDGESWDVIEEGIKIEEKSLNTYTHNFKTPATARYLEIEFVKYYAGRVSCADLTFYQTKADRDASGAGITEKYELKIGSNVIKVTKGTESYEKTIDVAPYIVNGSTLIPLRGLLEEMGAEIGWDGTKQKVFVTKGGLKLTLQIWNILVYAEDPRYGSIRYTLLNYPVIKDSRTFIPVRFVSEQLGYNVAWDGETQTITITSAE